MAVPDRTFLAECFLPGVRQADVADAGARARAAAAALRAEGRPIEYLGATLMADDEVVFHAFSARDAAVVAEAGRRARLRFERVVESINVDGSDVEPPAGLAGAQLEADRS